MANDASGGILGDKNHQIFLGIELSWSTHGMAKRDADTDEESPHSKRRRLTQEQNLAQPKKQVSSLQDLNTLIVVEGSTEAQSLASGIESLLKESH